MPVLNETLAALAAGRNVARALLVDFDFAEGAVHVWDGFGPLVVGGITYAGAAELGSVAALSFGRDDDASAVTFQLSGVSPEMLALAQDSDAVRGRDVVIRLQFLNGDEGSPDYGQPYDEPIPLAALIMSTIGYSASGPSQRGIKLTAETIWTARNTAAWTMFADRDQQARFPGDRGLEFMPSLQNKNVAGWLVYS